MAHTILPGRGKATGSRAGGPARRPISRLVFMPFFLYPSAMKLDINPRGNGACPLCVSHGSCRVQRKLVDNVDPVGPADGDGMEIVIYSCPYFKEKIAP